MGILSRFFKPTKSELVHLPAGSFTLDREGRVMTSTLPQSFPAERLKEIGSHVLASFRAAKKRRYRWPRSSSSTPPSSFSPASCAAAPLFSLCPSLSTSE
jgi:hypothetical protein